ncbi:MAG: nucleoside hydrolase [Erysipelotrichaceae bacterium]|nr:nucleoside hydrolase [Erysipelotrichaceae bacterium]
MSKRPVWIDTDTGIDDAFALLSALQLPNIEVVGCSAVSGNVELEKTFKNCRNVLSLAGREDIPVYKGADRPIMGEPHYAKNVHGENGIGDIEIPESKAKVETMSAYDALYECAKKYNGELVLVAVGPLSNVATAIFKYPELVKLIKEIDIMGGSVAFGGNSNTTAEFNIFGDPYAAAAVFKAGVPINMFGLDVTIQAHLKREEVDSIKEMGNKVTDFAYAISDPPMALYRMLGIGDILCLHDSCPLIYLNNPEIFSGKLAGVYVETQGGITLGKTVSDVFVKTDELFKVKNAQVMLGVDREKFAKIVLETLSKY